MSKPNLALSLWKKLSKKPGGKWFFSLLISRRAPYFSSIRATFEELRPGYCEVTAPKRRAVTNHIGTFHAIAMCNMAELAGGMMTEVSVPSTHRWIPKGMTVEYLKKGETGLRAIAELDPMPKFGAATELPVTVNVYDTQKQLVFRAVINMWISPKK
ncbi:MAG: hotdog fold domain-containing protein [Pseudomonadota bacterium]